MKYVELEGEKIPCIAVGTWSWGNGINGSNMVFGNNISEETLKEVFKEGLRNQLTLWDTAAV